MDKLADINTALTNLNKETGLTFEWKDNGVLDGYIEYTNQELKGRHYVITENYVRHHHIQRFEELMQEYKYLIIIANHILPEIKTEMRGKGIAYLDVAGNAYIKADALYININTGKQAKLTKTKGNRAFTKTGLKVLFHLLIDKDIVNLPQREIARRTGVALGNIPQVIEGLVETGYLLKLNKRVFVWQNREQLLERWLGGYETILRPTLKHQTFNLRQDWTGINLQTEKTVWGGEAAADILTNYLRPQEFILYTKETTTNLMRNYKLMPDVKGNLTVFEKFWITENEEKTAPPILIYADLMINGDNRNKEAAKLIYDEYIKPNL